MTSVSGLSGAGIINGDGKVVGVHQHGTIENGIPDKDRFGGGIVLSPEQVKWVKDIIAKYGVKGWYQGDNGNDITLLLKEKCSEIKLLLLAKINILSMKMVLRHSLKESITDV